LTVARPSPVTLRSKPPATPSNVTLVRPPMLVPRLALTAPTCPPVGLASLAGTLRAAGHRVTILDAIGESPDQFVPDTDTRFVTHGLTAEQIGRAVPSDCDVVGVSAMFSHEWPITRRLIERLREACPDALIVVGGEHATALPEFVLHDCPHVDVVVLGEGEETLAELVGRRRDELPQVPGLALRGIQGAEIVRTPTRSRVVQVDQLAPPAWDLLPIREYLDRGHGFGVHRGRSMPIVATRGCPYRCTFCSNPAMWTTRWVARSPAAVLDEIRGYIHDYDADNIDFYDLTAIVQRKWILEFCQLIIDSGLRFTWQLPSGTRSEALDDEVLNLLRRSGCRNMSYAPESGSPTVLERIKKRVELPRMKRSIRSAVRLGINCKANIILGFPGETHREILETLRFCVSLALLGLHDLSVTPFSPYPGTELYDELRADGRIGDLDDAYFLSLASYSDLSSAVSWSEHVSDRALGRYRIAGMALFYGTSFARRPWRIVPLVRNVIWSDTQESRLEMSLKDHLHKRRGSRAAPPRAGELETTGRATA
jgi:anaerobic magnesium-protoporphyrin IX monomethyl ester cyclase